MPSIEAKLLCEIKKLAEALNTKSYISVYPDFAAFPAVGKEGILYVDEATTNIYIWNGTNYLLLSTGITSLNGLTNAVQTFSLGTNGSDVNISSSGSVHTFNFPTASATNRGLLSPTDWVTFNNKQATITLTTVGTGGAATFIGNVLNIPQYQGSLSNPVTQVNFVVGQTGFPSNGATTYTNVLFSGADAMLVFRNGLPQFTSDPGDGDTYITFTGTTITFSAPLSTGEKIIILALNLS